MAKMYKGDRVVDAHPAQVRRLEVAGWSKTAPSDAPEPVDPQPVEETAASEPETATEDAADAEETATNGGDEGEAGEESADDAPADDADPDQDELPLAADSEQPGA
ncbi:MAG: hypothetical protein V3S78_07665 [Hyphomicrobium sp.]